jgi:hypothetical protein
MSGETRAAEAACVYVISCGLERAKIGVAGDARKRLRELQVGSPVELKLEVALTRVYAERRDAEAVAAELYRYFAARRVRGSWYRLTVAQVREALARPATREAPARARAAAAAAAAGEDPVAPRRGGRLRARTQKQLAYERRRRQERTRKQKQAARLLAQRMTQQQAARAVGVTSRTLRNWKAAPAFRRERERQHRRTAHPHTSARSRTAKAPGRRDPAAARHDHTGKPRPAAQPQPERPPAPPGQQQTAAEAGEQPPTGCRTGIPPPDAPSPPRSSSRNVDT